MVARVATFEGVDLEASKAVWDQAMERARPILEALAGYRGYLDLASPDGRQISIALFDSEADADAAEPAFDEEMPKVPAELFESWSGRRVSVERYEVLSDSRTG